MGQEFGNSLVDRFWLRISGVCRDQSVGAPWVAQLVKRLTSAQVMISRFVGSSPALGSELTAQSPLGILSPSLKINKLKKKKLRPESRRPLSRLLECSQVMAANFTQSGPRDLLWPSLQDHPPASLLLLSIH